MKGSGSPGSFKLVVPQRSISSKFKVMKLRILLLLFSIPSCLLAQEGGGGNPAYRLTDAQGRTIDLESVVERASKADVVFFGERHDDPIGHWLQLRLTRALYEEKGERLELGAEMYEAHQQRILDEYLDGKIRMKDLKREAKLWDNFETDYRPVLEFAAENSIPFLASNVPRRYASMVHRKGLQALDSLDADAHEWMAEDLEVDSTLPSYRKILKMGHASNGKRMVAAQALKDATMAERISDRYSEGECFLHFNGSFHSDAHEGIVHYLKKELPDAKVLVISSMRVEDLQEPSGVKWERKGDVNLLVPKDMTSTH